MERYQQKKDSASGIFFIIVIFILLLYGGMQFTGGESVSHKPKGSQVVTLISNTPEPAKNNLQLYTFGGITPYPPLGGVTPINNQEQLPGGITPNPSQTVNLNPPQQIGTSGKPVRQCGTGNSKEGDCCVMDGAVKDPSECCPGVPTCKEILDAGGSIKTANGMYSCTDTDPNHAALWCDAKPVIYLYPAVKTSVNVSLKVPGTIPVSDPVYPEGGWKNIESYPDGTLTYMGKQYHELFYEASITPIDPPETGIVILKENIKNALTKITTQLGLNLKEQQQFLAYWMPRLIDLNSPYLQVSLFTPQQKEIIDKVDISPKPETFIQFILYYKPLHNPIAIKPLILPKTPPKRNGFTAVEWGGIIDY